MAAAAEQATLLWYPRAVLVLVKLVFTPESSFPSEKSEAMSAVQFWESIWELLSNTARMN